MNLPLFTAAVIHWSFPGGTFALLATLSGIALLLGLSHAFTLKPLPRWKQLLLFALELLLATLILVLIGNPSVRSSHTEERYRPLRFAVLFDTSSSMVQPGLLGRSRLDEAVERWQKTTLPTDAEVKFFAFDEILRPVHEIAGLKKLSVRPIRNTKLAAATQEFAQLVNTEEFDAAVLFTDGIDSDSASVDAAAAVMASGRTRFLIVPMLTELAMAKFLEFQKLSAPGRAVKGATIPVEAAISYSNLSSIDQTEFQLTDARGTVLCRQKLRLAPGGGGALIHAELPAGAVGYRELRAALLLNEKVHREVCFSQETVERQNRRILLYQGSHDWAARFLKLAFANRGNELVSRRYNATETRNNFPDAEELAKFDAVILLNLEQKQILPELEQELLEFLRQGGGVLFSSGNPTAAAEFSHTALESLLPVTFEPPEQDHERVDRATSEFKKQIQGYARNTNTTAEENFLKAREFHHQVVPLKSSELTELGRSNAIFRAADGTELLPRFADFAPVASVKPGAETLLIHRDQTGKAHPVLIVQRFGRGRSAVLATDPLWRWRLTQESKRHDSELFWNNLMNWLGSNGGFQGGSWKLSNLALPLDAELKVELVSASPSDHQPQARLTGPNIERTLLMTPTGDPGRYQTSFSLESPGVYTLNSDQLRRSFTVSAIGGDRELQAPAPNLTLLRQFAATGENIALIAPDAALAASLPDAGVPECYTATSITPLWNRPLLLALLLGFYCTILILRRCWRLV